MKSGEFNVDSLFREKLEEFEPDLSPEAIDRMNRIISRKKNNLIFRRLSIAAGISLIVAGSVLLIRFRFFQPAENIVFNDEPGVVQSQSMNEAAKNEPDLQPPATSIQVNPERNEAASAINKKNIPPVVNNFIARNETVIIHNDAQEDLPAREIPIIEPIGRKTLAAGNPEIPSDFNGASGEHPATIKENGSPRPVVIEYILNPGSGVTDQGRSGAFAGIIEKANEIRNEVSLGNLREAKDQLFALEFIKTKKNNNSK